MAADLSTPCSSCPGSDAGAALRLLDWPDGEFLYAPAFWTVAQADALLSALDALPDWRQHHVRLFGRTVPSPRLSAWYGDPGSAYRYSGHRHVPLPWPARLMEVRRHIEQATGHAFNAVLGNRYRDGGDAMGWHSDDEAELGARPVIASATFGATRRFLLRHRRSGRRETLELRHGSLLLMAGDSQRCWQHSLPRTKRAVGLRINLTFRHIDSA